MLFCSMLCLLQLAAAEMADPPIPRPGHTDHTRLARWLAHYNTWATLSTHGELEDAASLAGCASAYWWSQTLHCCQCAVVGSDSLGVHDERVMGSVWEATEPPHLLCCAGANGSPSAGVVSFADGPLTGPAAGRLFFYLTPMDETGHGVQVCAERQQVGPLPHMHADAGGPCAAAV